MEHAYDIVVVGGGAAGLPAALAAARATRRGAGGQEQAGTPCSVAVLERNDRVGKSILQTGNGRCNFSNEHLATGVRIGLYHNAAFVQEAFAALQGGDADPVLAFLESYGLEWRQEPDGRRYPKANKASVVLDVLRSAAARLGVHELCGCTVAAIERPRGAGKPFVVRLEGGSWVRARSVVIACGGTGVEQVQVEGLDVLPARAVLGPLSCTPESRADTRMLNNIRVRCNATLLRKAGADVACVASEPGEVLFRTYGLSGICIFNLSRFAQAGDTVALDLLQTGAVSARDYMAARWHALRCSLGAQLTNEDMLRGLVLPLVAEVACRQAGLAGSGTCDVAAAGILADTLAHLSFEVEGVAETEACQVHRGGYAVDGVVPETMGVRGSPGLFVAGEAVDVDGPCGGFNLHWAWASGLLAGAAAAAWANTQNGPDAGDHRGLSAGAPGSPDGDSAG